MATRSIATDTMKRRLRKAFRRNLHVSSGPAGAILRQVRIQDKAYELAALVATMERIKRAKPSVSFRLKRGHVFNFRSGGGPINRRKWSYIVVMDAGVAVAELWVDIECLAISAPTGTKSAHKGHLLSLGHE